MGPPVAIRCKSPVYFRAVTSLFCRERRSASRRMSTGGSKGAMARQQPQRKSARLGRGADSCRLRPLVVVNQTNGVGWHHGGCPITDGRFLELFLGDGECVFGG